MNRKSEEIKEKQISEAMLSIENRVRHVYNQGYEQGIKDSKQETCEQIKCERDTAIKQLNELGYGLGEKIEPCEDAISRQAVQDYIAKYLSQYLYNDVREAVEVIDEYIGELPSVKPQEQKWIPVSERLPEPFRFVNCTCRSLIDDREDWVVETVYIPQVSDSPYSDWGNIPMLNSGDCKVVAWMYRDIPKPYKAESEE